MEQYSDIIQDAADIDWQSVLARTAAEPVAVPEWRLTIWPKPPTGERKQLIDNVPVGTVEAAACQIIAVSCSQTGKYLFSADDLDKLMQLPDPAVVIDVSNRLVESLNTAYSISPQVVAERIRMDGRLGMLLELSRELSMTTSELHQRADDIEIALQAGWNLHVNRLHEEAARKSKQQ